MSKLKTVKLITIKVTDSALTNFRIASAISGKSQYEVSEEASRLIVRKYNPIKSSKK
jgi:hypothetical protein